MPTPSAKINPSDIPVLTEKVDPDSSALPILTDIHKDEAEELSDAQCQQLASQLAPQLEKLLRAKLTHHFETQINEALLDMEAMLPDLIHATMKRQQPL